MNDGIVKAAYIAAMNSHMMKKKTGGGGGLLPAGTLEKARNIPPNITSNATMISE